MRYEDYPAEPFRIKSVETVKMIDKAAREEVIKKAGYTCPSISHIKFKLIKISKYF